MWGVFIPHGLASKLEIGLEGRLSYNLLHLTDSHGYAIRKEDREVGDVGEGEVSAGSPGGTNSSIVIEQPLIQIRWLVVRPGCES